MPASELNDRLDYLISYSSQLVFVCSDKIQRQSEVVENLLAQQGEHADLALLTANELTPLVTYREKIFRQLVSQSLEVDFNRPLKQLLAPLNQHNGPLLVSIFQAEKLPIQLVKELWDLVLSKRSTNSKHHINVLLMGLSEWAEVAKPSLGAKSKDQPIILNTLQPHQSTQTHETTDLESFIQEKREKFAQRIENRRDLSYVPQPIYKKWWVACLLSMLFLAIFAGILGWQYPDKVGAFALFIKGETPPSEQNDSATNPVGPIVNLAIPADKKDRQEVEEVEEASLALTSPDVNQPKPVGLLVTDWNKASAKVEEKVEAIRAQSPKPADPIDPEVAPTMLKDVLSDDIVGEPNLFQEQREAVQGTLTVKDYPVADPVTFEATTTQSGVQLSAIEPLLDGEPDSPISDTILALPSEHFVIQLAAMANFNSMQDFINNELPNQQLWLYKTRRYGGDWHVLLKAQDFPSIEEARAMIVELEGELLASTAFVKSLQQVKREITTSKP